MTTTFTMYPGNIFEGTIRVCRAMCTTGDEGEAALPSAALDNTNKRVPVAGMALGGLGQVDVHVQPSGATEFSTGGILKAYAYNVFREMWMRWPEMDREIKDGIGAQHWSIEVNSRDWLAFLPSGLSDASSIVISGSIKVRR